MAYVFRRFASSNFVRNSAESLINTLISLGIIAIKSLRTMFTILSAPCRSPLIAVFKHQQLAISLETSSIALFPFISVFLQESQLVLLVSGRTQDLMCLTTWAILLIQ
jgi:hypothetical protein